jgi:ABC-type oligopeptide transport system ATPase subunit
VAYRTIDSAGVPLVEVRGVKKYFHIAPPFFARLLARQKAQVVRAVDGVDLKIWPGETVGLVGESGCGKTTVGRVLTRLYEPTEGQILLRGWDIHTKKPASPSAVVGDEGLPVDEIGLGSLGFYQYIQMIFQNPYSSLNPRKTVRQIVSVPLKTGASGI